MDGIRNLHARLALCWFWFVLGEEVGWVSGNAVLVGTPVYFGHLGKIAMGRRCGGSPVERRCFPWIIVLDLPSFPDAQEEVDHERKLEDGQRPGGHRHELVPLKDPLRMRVLLSA